MVTERPREASEVLVEDESSALHTRRPLDLVRLVIAVLLGAALIALASVSAETWDDLSQALFDFGEQLGALVGVIAVGSGFVQLLLYPAMLVVLLQRRWFRLAIELVAAVILAFTLSWLASELLLGSSVEGIVDAFEPFADPQRGDSPVPGSVAGIVAAFTATPLLIRRLRIAGYLALAGGLITGLLDAGTTVPGALLALLIGWAAGLVVRLVSGVRTFRPHGQQLAELLRKRGLEPTALREIGGGNPIRYEVHTETAGQLDLFVLDRHRQGTEFLTSLFRRLRLREELVPREALTFTGSVERRVLLTHAAVLAGIRTPHVVLALAAEPDAAVIAFEHIHGRPLDSLSGHEVSDAALDDLWRQMALLREVGIAHKALTGRRILVEGDQVWLTDFRNGEVAATRFALRGDLAQALVAAALAVSPERAVDSALRVLGRTVVGDAVPLLQPLALPRRTRQELSEHRGLLSQVRDRVVERAEPHVLEPAPIERFKPQTLVTGGAVLLALYLVTTQLADVDIVDVLREADWRWMLVALGATALSYVGATWALLGFVAQPVPYVRAFAAQIALGFVKLVMPTTVGSAAVNVRLLTKADVPAAAAAAGVAASQVAAVVITVPLLLVLGLLTGRAATAGLTPSTTALAVVALALLTAGAIVFFTPLRARARRAWTEFIEVGLPRLLDVLQSPVKLAQGVGGNLLTTFSLTLALDASVRAVGGEMSFAVLALVFLTGNTVGTAVPTPGGIGAVEVALTATLAAAGAPASVAAPAVLLFRLATFWLPILPGWFCWVRLQRAGAL